MDKKFYIQVLEFLEHSIGMHTNLSPLILTYFGKLDLVKEEIRASVIKEVNKTLEELKARNLIQYEDYTVGHKTGGPHPWFDTAEVNAKITIEGIKYLQSEKDDERNRAFMKLQEDLMIEQKEILSSQTKIQWMTLGISIVSLIFIAYSAYDSYKGGVEKRLRELVIAEKDFKKMVEENVQLHSLKTFQKNDSLTRQEVGVIK